jgi:lysophospholipase L1-like esterase
VFVGMLPVEDENPLVKGVFSSKRISEFEQVLRNFVTEQPILFVPLFELFQQHMQAGKRLFSDGLHPNAEGHELMYTQIKERLNTLV